MRFIRYGNGKTVLLQSDIFLKYKQEFIEQIDYDKEPIDYPVNIQCLYYRGDKRKTDLVNLENGTLDLLVESKVLKDDNYKIVVSMDGSRVYYDKENPRTEIIITNINKGDDNK